MDETTRLGDGRPAVLAGRYELRGLVGHGGMADVQLAHDRQLDRPVAVKMLHAHYANDPAFLARFRREAQAAASLNHANIVAVYDTGQSDSRPFIVMEYVKGQSLKDLLDGERVTPQRAAEIAADTAGALNYASQRDLVHRDIKPANIMISDEGQVKVTDFGIARALNAESMTQTAAVFGTAAYVAPEQARGEPVDGRTDLYALGCVLYEMLAARPPFQADSAVALAYKHVSEVPAPPSTHNPEVPEALDAIVMRAMAKDPDHRYADGREFAADLRRAIDGLPVAEPTVLAYEQTQAMPLTQEQPATGEPYEEEESSKRSGFMWLLLLLLLIGAGIAAFLFVDQVLFGDGEEEEAPPDEPEPVEVASVVDLPVDEAEARLSEQGLESQRSEGPETDNDDQIGLVESQNPEAGTMLDAGDSVELFVYRGAETVEVPDLVGMTADEAIQQLGDQGLEASQSDGPETSDPDQVGRVESHQPSSGEQVQPGDTVELSIYQEIPTVTVPSLVNMNAQEAEQALAEQGLSGEQQPGPDASSSDQVGLVESHDPPEGAEVEPDSVVQLFIYGDVPTVEVPDVSERTTGDAERVLGENDLQAGDQITQYTDDIPEGLVIETDPGAGSEVPEGSSVALIVSDGVEPSTVPDVVGLSEEAAITAMEQAGLDPDLQYRNDEEIADGEVISTQPGRGNQLEPGSDVIIVISEGPQPTESPSPSPTPSPSPSPSPTEDDEEEDD